MIDLLLALAGEILVDALKFRVGETALNVVRKGLVKLRNPLRKAFGIAIDEVKDEFPQHAGVLDAIRIEWRRSVQRTAHVEKSEFLAALERHGVADESERERLFEALSKRFLAEFARIAKKGDLESFCAYTLHELEDLKVEASELRKVLKALEALGDLTNKKLDSVIEYEIEILQGLKTVEKGIDDARADVKNMHARIDELVGLQERIKSEQTADLSEVAEEVIAKYGGILSDNEKAFCHDTEFFSLNHILSLTVEDKSAFPRKIEVLKTLVDKARKYANLSSLMFVLFREDPSHLAGLEDVRECKPVAEGVSKATYRTLEFYYLSALAIHATMAGEDSAIVSHILDNMEETAISSHEKAWVILRRIRLLSRSPTDFTQSRKEATVLLSELEHCYPSYRIDTAFLSNLSGALTLLGMQDELRRIMEYVKAIDPELHLFFGMVSGFTDENLEAYSDTLNRLSQSNRLLIKASALNLLASLYFFKRDVQKARESALEAVELFPLPLFEKTLYFVEGGGLLVEGRTDQAIQCLEKALKIPWVSDISQVSLHSMLAQAYLVKGDLEKSRSSATKVLEGVRKITEAFPELESQAQIAAEVLIRAFQEEGDVDALHQARELLERICSRTRIRRHKYASEGMLAFTHLLEGDEERFERCFATMRVEGEYEKVDVALNKIFFLIGARRFEKAVMEAEVLLPNVKDTHLRETLYERMGEAKKKMGKSQEAMEDLQRAYEACFTPDYSGPDRSYFLLKKIAWCVMDVAADLNRQGKYVEAYRYINEKREPFMILLGGIGKDSEADKLVEYFIREVTSNEAAQALNVPKQAFFRDQRAFLEKLARDSKGHLKVLALHQLAHLALEASENDYARSCLEDIPSLNPDREETESAHLMIGHLDLIEGFANNDTEKLKQAEGHFEKALAYATPENSFICLWNIAKAYLRSSRLASAFNYLEKARAAIAKTNEESKRGLPDFLSDYLGVALSIGIHHLRSGDVESASSIARPLEAMCETAEREGLSDSLSSDVKHFDQIIQAEDTEFYQKFKAMVPRLERVST